MLKDNIFQKILDKQIQANIAYEDDICLASTTSIRRRRRTSSSSRARRLRPMPISPIRIASSWGTCIWSRSSWPKQLKLDDGYRIVINCQDRGGQTVPHLHFHLMGGRDFHWPPG